MVREKEIFLVRMMKVSDALTIGFAFVLAYFITLSVQQLLALGNIGFSTYYSFSLSGAVEFLRRHIWLVITTVPAWVSLMSLDGVYSNFRTKLFIETAFRVLRTGVASVLLLGSMVFLLKMIMTSRMYVGIYAVTAYFCLLAEKAIWKKILDYSYRQGYNLVNLLIVGTGKRARDFMDLVKAHSNWGLQIVGVVDDDPKLMGKHVMEYEIIGRVRDIPRIIRDKVVDRVIFVVPRIWLNRIEPAIRHCEREGVNTAVCVDLFKPKLAHLELSSFAGIPLINFQTSTAKEWQLFVKRFVDWFIALLGLIALSPVFLFVILGIKLTSKGPIFYRQVRCGLNGRNFTLFKFRSMVVGAEMRRRALEKQNEMNGPVFKMKRDPRVTGFGRFLRKFSLDELPQLYNVLKGDMSLVGPRPALPAEVDLYQSWQRRRLSMKPGITCIWQVSGRNRIDFDQWMEMDLQYIDDFSLWLDFKLMFRTIFVVMTGYGAA